MIFAMNSMPRTGNMGSLSPPTIKVGHVILRRAAWICGRLWINRNCGSNRPAPRSKDMASTCSSNRSRSALLLCPDTPVACRIAAPNAPVLALTKSSSWAAAVAGVSLCPVPPIRINRVTRWGASRTTCIATKAPNPCPNSANCRGACARTRLAASPRSGASGTRATCTGRRGNWRLMIGK